MIGVNLTIFVSGWLTSVPLQPTRAYCKYCKKDLHAHRLSLLKHTCTMKHQRAALLLNTNDKVKDNSRTVEIEENEDDTDYVVERLDIEEDYSQEKVESMEVGTEEMNDKESADTGDLCLRLHLSDEEENKPVIKKIELDEVCDLPYIIYVYYICI